MTTVRVFTQNSYNVHSLTVQFRLLYHNLDGPRVRNVAVERQANKSEKSQSLVSLIPIFVLANQLSSLVAGSKSTSEKYFIQLFVRADPVHVLELDTASMLPLFGNLAALWQDP